ncbi:hypothetical protein EI546_10290 [Aequorivita sp. H23M31]|uniref:Bacterial Pleckstrin homology domain-containing protein n=1 Tax=Aequorivita ciconiae TaxID=2494375 RepID=A0A410G4E0_9FLAO|nr:PH domain-containing protein [Aequorivita sp. H23M31]QAA82085.1 hypothetical protein EI546_10290 [Aequorivita sp. H23M31]
MKVYRSKSSLFVKIATSGALVLVIMIAVILVMTNDDYGIIGGLIVGAIILGTLIYFYANSLNKIIVDKDSILLKKNIGQISIPKSEIVEVNKFGYSNLSMTYGSKGVFGFIGNTMDDSISLVKDRNNMIGITTQSKKYIFSTEKSDELVREIRPR